MSEKPDFSKMKKLTPGFYVDEHEALHVDFGGLCADLGFTPSRESYEALMRAAKEMLPNSKIEDHTHQVERRVHIVQLFCPQRHCMLSTTYLYPDVSDEKGIQALMDGYEQGVRAGVLKRVCGLCGSTDLKPEVGVTNFPSMAAAMPHFEKMQAEQLAMREYIHAARKAARN